jgi:hypothetical protein
MKISRKDLLNNYDEIYNKYYDTFVEKKDNCVENKVIKCKKCNKIFNHQSNCSTHMKKHCPIINKEKSLLEEYENKTNDYIIIQQKLEEELEENKNELMKCKNELEEYKNKRVSIQQKYETEIENERNNNRVLKEYLEYKIKELESK